MHIAIVYSLPSKRMQKTKFASADEDTAEIAKMVAKGLMARGYTVELCPIGEDEIQKIALIKADCVFNLIEWCGQDITLAERAFAQLRALNLPITGSSESLFILTGDKIRMKQALKEALVSTPWGVGISSINDQIPDNVPYPVIVKPALEHCSIGLSEKVVARNSEELVEIVTKQLHEFEQPVLIEEFIPGRELLVYLVEERGGVRILPIVEMLFSGGDPMSFQTYDAKWVEGSKDYLSTYYDLASLSENEEKLVRENCLKAFKQLGFWGYARFDLRLREGIPYILETNANPSVYDATEELTNIEDEVITGIKFPDYLAGIVKAAADHFQAGHRV